jgi:hypothetical protein
MNAIILSSLLCFVIGYGLGLFVDKLDKREKRKNGGR